RPLLASGEAERPKYVVSDIAPPSRYGSIGGFVTSANVCCKYLNSVGWWAEKTVSTRSWPIEERGSFRDFAISFTNTARSKSHPQACAGWPSAQLRSAGAAPTMASVCRV